MTAAARLLVALLLAVRLAAPAHAGPDGTVPAPGLCDYPGVGVSFQIMNVWHYNCDFPLEENGSHWHCELDGVDVQAAVTAGFSFSMFSVGGALSGQVGALIGSCSWRCPDLSLAAQPNPPGAWKNHLNPSRCKTVAPAPLRAGDEAAAVLPAPPNSPTGAVQDLMNPPGPAVTNPDNPNPDATVNPR